MIMTTVQPRYRSTEELEGYISEIAELKKVLEALEKRVKKLEDNASATNKQKISALRLLKGE